MRNLRQEFLKLDQLIFTAMLVLVNLRPLSLAGT